MSLTGMIGAMDLEMEKLIGLLDANESRVISGITFHRGTLFGREVVLAVCGVGKCFAALCAQTMILTYHPDCVINIGVAGSLTKELSVGDIAVASDVVQYDMDTSAVGDPVGMISGINLINLPCSPALGERLCAAAAKNGIKAVTGTIATGDCFLASWERKHQIGDQFHAIACEMEGGGIAQACYVNGVDCIVLRSISDSVDGGCEDYEQFKHLAAEHSATVLEAFLAGRE